MAYEPIAMGVIVRAQLALQLTNAALGQLLGVSKRTVQRWLVAGAGPTPWHAAALAREVARVDPELARELEVLAEAAHAALGEDRLKPLQPLAPPAAPEAAPPAPQEPRPDPLESVVYAACAAADLTPKVARAAVAAAFGRALELGADLPGLAKRLAEP
jgi:type IV secretory pathway TrbD component